MTFLDSIVLGLTQGVTEFVPVSSSGHLTLVQNMLGLGSDHLFLEFINIGTLLALLIFYRKKIWKIIKDVFVGKNYKLAVNLIITSVPAGLIGLLLSGFISDNPFFGSVYTIAIGLLVVGLIMVVLEKLPRMSEVKDGAHLPWYRALLIGFAQVFALIPGVSRSGSTIITGRLSGLSAKESAEYSFLASIPIMCAVVLKTFVSSTDRAYFMDNLPTLALSNAVAFVSGLLAIGFVMRYLAKRKSLRMFGWYRVVLAVVVLIVLFVSN